MASLLLLLVVVVLLGPGYGQPLTFHVIPHTHDDVGWIKTADEYFLGSSNYLNAFGVQVWPGRRRRRKGEKGKKRA